MQQASKRHILVVSKIKHCFVHENEILRTLLEKRYVKKTKNKYRGERGRGGVRALKRNGDGENEKK